MTNGYTYLLTVRFVRALAFLSEQAIRDMVREVESKTQCKYPKELIIQAINMAPQCRLEQTISNLVNNAVSVFESILQTEPGQIIAEVRAIRDQRIYPVCRIRYQIIGEQYRQMIL